MFSNLKTTIRNLRRNFSYSAINIAGLAIGITASVFIFTWVYHERSFDRYHPDSDRIYRVFNSIDFGEGDPWIFTPSPYPLALAIGRDIPEVENTAMMSPQMIEGIKVGDEVFSVGLSGAYVDKTWLEMFDYEPVDGSFDTFGSHPYSVVLTESEATKYFGKSRAVGQTISINNSDYTIQAVVKDNPSNSSFQYNIMASTNMVLKENVQFGPQDWGSYNAITFVKLRPGTDATQVCAKMNDILAANKEQNNATVCMRSLADIHFETDMEDYYITHGNKRMVSIFSLLGVLLLCTACINYVNLATAKANTRVKEIGMRKIIGARRIALFGQFIVESFIFSLVAALISLVLVWMLYPQYRLLAGGVDLSLTSPVVWAILGIILVATTALNGVYPALMLSSFQPMNFLKGMGFMKMKDSKLRKGLVIFQFTLSAALIVCVIVIYSQMQYVKNMDPGYNHEELLTMPIPNKAIRSLGKEKGLLTLQSVKGELQSSPTIAGVAVCDQDVTNIGSMISGADWNGRADDFNPNLRVMAIDTDYGQLLGMKLTEGRWFSDDNAADETNVILNETAIRELNIHEPYVGQRFDLMGMKGNIIGVVNDFHFRSLHEKVSPLALYHSFFMGGSYRVTMKTQAGKHAEAVQAAKSVWKQFFPDEPFEYAFLDDAFNKLYQSDTRTSRLILIFSVLAVVIAVLGLFGLSTFAIERRTKEIGMRKILGASVAGIINMLTKEFLLLVTIAFAIAVPIAWWAMSHWLDDFAYRINISVWIFVIGGILTLIIALIAIGTQAIKAATANPVKAIKAE